MKHLFSRYQLALSIVLGALAALASQAVLPSGPKKPFTAISVERFLEAGGSEKYRFERTTYRSSNGSLATNESRYYMSEGRPTELHFRVIEDVDTKGLTSIYPQVSAKMTSSLTAGRLNRLKSSSDDCTRRGFEPVTDGSAFTVSGFPTIQRRRVTPSGGSGRPATEDREWVIRELGCFVAKYERRWRDEQGVYLPGSVVRETTRIVLGEPAASAFFVAADLKESSPSQVMKAQNAMQGRTCTECDRRAMEVGDRAYFSRQR
jgi:hypothetical protein